MKEKKTLVFLIEYRIDVEDGMEVNLGEVLDKMREAGAARLIDARVDISKEAK